MKTFRAFIGLGSNVGDRYRYLSRAAEGVREIAGVKVVWYSSVYETDPYGNTDQPKFLNAVGEVETTLEPEALLAELKRLETVVGRTAGVHWGPREIDLDVLLYDGVVVQGESVIVPHPELERRRFVLVPLREIAPDLVHPVSGLTMEELAAACADQGRVVKTSFKIRP